MNQLLDRTNVLGVGVSALNMSSAVKSLLTARKAGQRGYVCVTGVHGVIESQRDPRLKTIHNRSFLTVPDGMPTVWMGREQGFTKMGRVYGPDLMLRLMAATSDPDGFKSEVLSFKNSVEGKGRAQGDIKPNHLNPKTEKMSYTHFLYGATEEMLEKLKANLEQRFPGVQIVGTYAPPFRPLNEAEEAELAEIVSELKPDFFWVGLSTPKQERFMAAHDPRALGFGREASGFGHQVTDPNAESPMPSVPHPLECGIMLGVGAAFPIHAGLQKDAPEWIKNSGLQWFHRLCQEPRRLWRRYLDIVPTFLWLAFLQVMGIKRFTLDERRWGIGLGR